MGLRVQRCIFQINFQLKTKSYANRIEAFTSNNQNTSISKRLKKQEQVFLRTSCKVISEKKNQRAKRNFCQNWRISQEVVVLNQLQISGVCFQRPLHTNHVSNACSHFMRLINIPIKDSRFHHRVAAEQSERRKHARCR